MKKQLIQVNVFTADLYDEITAWETFINTVGYQQIMKENPNTIFVVNHEYEPTTDPDLYDEVKEYYYIYKVV